MKRTKEDWLFLIEDQQQSGMTMAEYCRINSISISAFYNARSRFGFTKQNGNCPEELVNDSGTEAVVETANEDIIDCLDHQAVTPIQNLKSKNSLQEVKFSKVIVGDDFKSKPKPAAAPPDDPLDFYCNGIRLTMPGGISDRNLFRVMEACTRL